jgi:hypothetical protein
VPPTAAARLQHLTLACCLLPKRDGGVAQARQDRLFSCLSCLTHLQLDGDSNDNGLQSCCLRHVSTLASLQELALERTGVNRASAHWQQAL